MIRTAVALIATLMILPGAWAQDDAKNDKEKAKEEAKKKDDDAKAALASFRKSFNAGKSADDKIEAIQKLENADPHPLIRSEFGNILASNPSIDVRIAAASALGRFKKDVGAAEILLNNAKAQKDEGLKRKCLQKFGAVAPFGKSLSLKPFFNDENNLIVREAIEAIEAINSIRMLQPLVELLGELENIREDKADQGGQPLPGVPQGDNTNNQKVKRKKELTDPVRKAINTLWKKYDSRTKLNNYTEANSQIRRNQPHLMKIQETEDKEDKGMKEEAAASKEIK
jgi:hypothetical protein